uniref:Globin domain-containing protein n=1 Tax=Monopterus albus TaxID=43700 RepID=A0A3Q3KJ89_MONAL
ESLSGGDMSVVKAFWDKVHLKADEVGALARMLTVYPHTKTYFSHWSDLSPESAQVKKHGAWDHNILPKYFTGFLYQSSYGFSNDLSNSWLEFLAHNIIVCLAMYFPSDFTAEAHVFIDRFLQNLSFALSDGCR